MSDNMLPLEAIPLPGETKETQRNENKRPKLRRLQDTNQPSSILVTKVVATKPAPPDPASKLKAITEKQKSLPQVSAASEVGKLSSQGLRVSTSTSNQPTTINEKKIIQAPILMPPSQTIVDELFKDFIATKKKEEKVVDILKVNSDVATSVEEMNRLLDEEISLINASSATVVKSSQKGRWDCEVLTDKGKKCSETASFEHSFKTDSLKESNDCLPKVDMLQTDQEDALKKGKLGLKVEITKESLSWINSGEVMDVKRKKVLEEGEVLSSSTDENSDEESDDSDDGDNILRETGSVSSSDNDSKSKSKKKKKRHKNKHKKKKKHKSSKGEHKSSKDKTSKDEKKSGKKKKEKSEDSRKKEKEDDRKKDKKEHRSKPNKRKKSKSRSRTPKRRRSRSRSSSHDHHKVRSRSPRRQRSQSRERYDEWDARNYGSEKRLSRSRSRSQDRCLSRDSYREERHRDHRRRDLDERRSERTREKYSKAWVTAKVKDSDDPDLRVRIDKSKLRKIAIANVLAAVKAGEQGAEVDLATLKAGGKSVAELTDFCKQISQKEKGYSDSDSDSDYTLKSDDEGDTPFINHPFKVRDPSTLPNIVMNIRNSKQLPVLTPQAKATQSAQLRIQFPVSSGSVHRQKEHEWVPVEKTTAPPTTPAPTVTVAPTPPATTTSTTTATGTKTSAAQAAAEIATASVPPTVTADKVFPDPPSEPIDIGAVISERLSLVRRLTENPYDVEALSCMHKAQAKSSRWAQSKVLPGQFLGSTGVQTLTQEELAGNKKQQAWSKKVLSTTPSPTGRLLY